jgi:hypothetical protein
MRRRGRKRDWIVVVFLVSVILWNYPILGLFDRPDRLWGIPILYVYVFAAWAIVIGLVALIVEYR